ncbi:Uncharacterised protein [Mycobacteroides abscessus subsp. abscessus]|nr:Uncharacterised protein [Mycobacteroides abscessus subsp. abscessus]SKW25403.1 Uncharacterised protein [Mycobacteroides abscessus subsp. abscessus]
MVKSTARIFETHMVTCNGESASRTCPLYLTCTSAMSRPVVVISAPKTSRRKGTRASSRIVTIVAWLTCWYMSISDQRTGTAAT